MTESHHATTPGASLIPRQRYYGFDALRVIAVSLVIIFHASIPFMKPAYFFWPAEDASTSAFFGHFSSACLALCLPVMFLLAGFFASMSRKSRGVGGFLKGRVRRIIVPLAISAVTIVPILQIITILAARNMDSIGLARIEAIGIDSTLRNLRIRDFFQSGIFIETFRWWHLWFLWYLLIYYILHITTRPLLERILPARWLDRLFWKAMNSPLGFAALIGVTAILLAPMSSLGVDTPSSVVPTPRILLYYLVFYVFGAMLYRCSDVLAGWRENWAQYLLMAGCIALPCLIYLRSRLAPGIGPMGEQIQAAAVVCNSLFIWLAVLGLIGLCQRYLNRPSRAIRYMADASYWFYLVHLPPMIAVQLLLKDAQLPAGIKFALVLAAVLAPLALTYHYFYGRNWVVATVAAASRSAQQPPENLTDSDDDSGKTITEVRC